MLVCDANNVNVKLTAPTSHEPDPLRIAPRTPRSPGETSDSPARHPNRDLLGRLGHAALVLSLRNIDQTPCDRPADYPRRSPRAPQTPLHPELLLPHTLPSPNPACTRVPGRFNSFAPCKLCLRGEIGLPGGMNEEADQVCCQTSGLDRSASLHLERLTSTVTGAVQHLLDRQALGKHHTTPGGYQERNAIDADAPVSLRLRRIFSNSSAHRRFPSPTSDSQGTGSERITLNWFLALPCGEAVVLGAHSMSGFPPNLTLAGSSTIYRTAATRRHPQSVC